MRPRILTTVFTVFVTVLFLVGSPPPAVNADGAGGTPRVSAKPVDPDYTKAVASIKAGDFAAAIPLLESVVARDESNADAYNWLAYAVRRNGDPARSIPLYQKALALNANHRGANEYLGQLYLKMGNTKGAQAQLAKLQKLCGRGCEEYESLRSALAKAGGRS